MLGIIGWWLCCLGWVATVDWVGRDATRYRLAPGVWIPVCVLVFLVAALVAWWIPSGIAVAAIVPLAWLVPALVYVVARNKSLPIGKHVLTPNHLRNVASRLGKRVGIKIEPGLEDDEPPMPDIAIEPAAGAAGLGDGEEARRRKLAAMPGYRVVRSILTGAVLARASKMIIEPAADGVQVRYEVDTVWQKRRMRVPPQKRGERDRYPEAPPLRTDEGAAAVAVLRAAAGLGADGRGPQSGECVVTVDGKPQTCRVTQRTTGGGSHLEVTLPSPPAKWKTLAELGVSEKLLDRIKASLRVEKGLLLLASPAGAGLTTTTDLVVETADRLMRDFLSIEDEAAPAREIQNVKVRRFDADKGVTPIQTLEAALREYPQVIVTRDIRDKPLLLELTRLAGESHFVIVSLKAHDAIDAVQRLVQSGVPPEALARCLVGVLSQRLVRRLCPRCRESGPPAPDLLARFRRRPEQVPQIHGAATDGCSLCQGAGYLGRTGLFEFASGQMLREAVAKKVDAKGLRDAAIRDGLLPLTAAGFMAAIEGTTSYPEVERVLAVAAAPRSTPPATQAKKGRTAS